MSKKIKIILTLTFVLVVFLPYLLAWMVGGEYVFSGFLLNPVDGNTYLAKIYQGWSGSWKFVLPYTSEPGEGAYLYGFYLLLGHLARWLGLPGIAVFHGARLAGAAILALALIEFFQRMYPHSPGLDKTMLGVVLFGSGMGWVVAFAGLLPSDFWVAEAYPFLSAYANPHFPLGLAILVLILTLALESRKTWHYPVLVVAGLVESAMMQFGLVVTAGILAAWTLWEWLEDRSVGRAKRFWEKVTLLVSILLLGGPFLLYQVWVIQTHPVLSGWNVQNLTPAPPLWDFLLSLSPAFWLALLGAWYLWPRREHPYRRLLLAWFFVGLVLVYLPFSLQRRFMLGYYIPTVALAGFGLYTLIQKVKKNWLVPTFFVFSFLTNFFLLLAGILGAVGHAPQIFLHPDEYRAIQTLRQETPADALVLASPELGSHIPALTGRRVIYGHPFETVNAEEEEQAVLHFFRGDWTEAEAADFIQQRGVNYILVGEREQALAQDPARLENQLSGYEPVIQEGTVTVYQVRQRP